MKCDSPYYVMPKAGTEKVPVPCGRCPNCKIKRVNQWVFRLLEEEKNHKHSHFITLTYDTDTVPITDNGFMSLDLADLQKFFKRLRKFVSGTIKYYAVGEYGSTNLRPHYHAIVFGVDDVDMYGKAWSLDGKPIGMVHVGNVNSDSIAYTMKYIDKENPKSVIPGWTPYKGRDDRKPEFSVMSKRLGSTYVNKQSIKYHHADLSRMYVVKPGGHRVSMPKYYRDKIYDEKQRRIQSKIAQSIADESSRMEERKYYMQNPFSTAEQYQLRLTSAKYYRHSKFYKSLKKREL